jgi:iron(II)-dependent oxidoreductase
VLIWPTYPNMGIDNRNQHDLIHSMPGGIAGVRQMIADFHRRGVRVLFPMMMWDQGTRQPDRSWPDEIASLMAEIGADGINASPWPFRWLQTRLGTRSSSNRRMVHPMKRSPGT